MIIDLKEIRRRLHKVPEIGFQEVQTSKIIKEYLTKFGYECITVAKTGVIAIKKGKENSTIAFRSDMDALQIEEKTGVDFQSQNKGFMHACGHDAHMTILIGFAEYMSKLENLNKNIMFIFQPAEESPGGAKVIVEEGVLKTYNVESIFGLHVYPELDEGKIGLTSGAMMAQNAEINITINSKSSHGAMPHLGIDGIYVASQLIQSYQSVISRNIDPLESAVITLGKITGGDVRNIIANKVSIEGTVRAFNSKIFNQIRNRLVEINKGLEEMFKVDINFDFIEFYPAVINDEKLFNLVKNNLCDDEYEVIKPIMTAEDFSYYQKEIPGLFMMLGTRNLQKGYVHPLHSCYFNFDENVLEKGVYLYINIAKYLKII